MSNRWTVVAAALLLGAPALPVAYAQQGDDGAAQKQEEKEKKQAKLAIGDMAPPLAVEKFLKGDPVTGFEKGRVYVVEFWATWCGPCIASMPHITELQKEYKEKGVTIIGVNIWETDTYDDATLAKVEKFVEKNSEKMGYTIAYDGAAKKMDEGFMRAAGRSGIPSAFLVNKEGRIAWMGHPMGLDSVLEKVIAGTWDIEKAKRDMEAEAAVTAAMRAARGDPEKTLAALDEVVKNHPETRERVDGVRWNLLLAVGRYDEAYRALGPIVDKAIADKNAAALNQYSWTIVDPDGEVETKNLDIAMKAASKAAEFTEGKDGAILDTLARVHFLKGDVAKAIELQEKAINVAPEEMKDQLKPALDEYKAAQKKA